MLTSEIKCVTYFQIAYEIKLYILDQFSKIKSSAPMVDLSTLLESSHKKGLYKAYDLNFLAKDAQLYFVKSQKK